MPTPLPTGPDAGPPSRRALLLGAAAVGAVPLLAACTGTSTSATPAVSSASSSDTSAGASAGASDAGSAGASTGASAGGSTTAAAGSGGSTTLGSSGSDAVPKSAIAAMVTAFQKSGGAKVAVNTVSHNDFQNAINSYLQGSPDDAFTWFAGYRMRFYAKKGLVAPLDDVWTSLAPDFSPAITAASTGDDGKKYFIPNYNYPWGFFYKKSLWAKHGYTAPTTWDAFVALCKKMKADGLIPIAFGDKDGWPAMGTFDYLNLRVNGYKFHVDLLSHKESWTSPKVAKVFDMWKEVLPYHAPNSLGRIWQDAATTVVRGTTGMYLLGSFVAQQFPPSTLADYDFFLFPAIDPANGQDTIEAPIDGFMLSKKGANNPTAKAMLKFFGSAEGQNAYAAVDPSNVATNKKADLSKLTALQKKSQQVISSAKNITQFLDRDSLPAFANNVMIPALQTFISSGTFQAATVDKQATQLFSAGS